MVGSAVVNSGQRLVKPGKTAFSPKGPWGGLGGFVLLVPWHGRVRGVGTIVAVSLDGGWGRGVAGGEGPPKGVLPPPPTPSTPHEPHWTTPILYQEVAYVHVKRSVKLDGWNLGFQPFWTVLVLLGA